RCGATAGVSEGRSARAVRADRGADLAHAALGRGVAGHRHRAAAAAAESVMRTAAIASFTVHVVIMLLLFAIGTGAPRIIPGPEVVQVALIAPPSAVTATPPPEKREHEPRGETLKPSDETGVKLAPLKPRRQEVEKPHAKKEPEPEPTT